VIEYIYGRDQELMTWAAVRLPAGHRFRDDAKTIGLASDGWMRAVTVYDTFSTNDCLVSVVSDGKPNWFTRDYAAHTMRFPFVQCGFKRITCLIALSNRASVQFTLRFGGWQHEGMLREAAPDGGPLLLFGMLRRDCLWLTKEERNPPPIPAETMAV
jgi:hypothetical protein